MQNGARYLDGALRVFGQFFRKMQTMVAVDATDEFVSFALVKVTAPNAQLLYTHVPTGIFSVYFDRTASYTLHAENRLA